MKLKVHWIIDGIAEIEASSLSDAEKIVDQHLNKIIIDNKDLTDTLGAKSFQGKAYFPGQEEKG
jgi:hypothetical protein